MVEELLKSHKKVALWKNIHFIVTWRVMPPPQKKHTKYKHNNNTKHISYCAYINIINKIIILIFNERGFMFPLNSYSTLQTFRCHLL